MKKKTKKPLIISAMLLAMAVSMAVGAYAATNLQKITAYLNYDISVIYDGQTKTLADANGKQVYPISYEGTTYVPIRAFANLFGVNVDWDQEQYAVLLGKTGVKDFINSVPPYAGGGNYKYVPTTKAKTVSIGGKTYDHWINYYQDAYTNFNLEGLYTTLTFDIYSERDTEVFIYGDNDVLLQQFSVNGNDLPKTIIVDVRNIQQLKIKTSDCFMSNTYIINATIE